MCVSSRRLSIPIVQYDGARCESFATVLPIAGRPSSGKKTMSFMGAKFLAAAAVERSKDQLMEELQEKLKLEELESVRSGCN